MKDYLILTKYVYPLNIKEIKYFFNGIYFDNPRTKEEINYVANLLKKLNRDEVRLPEEKYQVGEGYITLRMVVEDFLINNCDNEVVKEFYEKNNKEINIYKLLAKMWVIVRCDNVLDKEKLKGIFTIKINSDIYENNKKDLQNYSVVPPKNYNFVNDDLIFQYLKFMSFIIGNNDNIYFSILIDNKYGSLDKNTGIYLYPMLLTVLTNKKNNPKDFPFCSFNYILAEILKLVDLIGDKFVSYKFKHICKIIDSMNYTNDDSLILLSLVSIIEMLITHNPENSRFNVEESISRQFVNKTVFLLYENDNNVDIKRTKEELKLAYQMRSNITHGNIDDINKTMKILHKFYGLNEDGRGIKYESLDSALNRLNVNISKYVKIILKNYLDCEIKLEIIKEV